MGCTLKCVHSNQTNSHTHIHIGQICGTIWKVCASWDTVLCDIAHPWFSFIHWCCVFGVCVCVCVLKQKLSFYPFWKKNMLQKIWTKHTTRCAVWFASFHTIFGCVITNFLVKSAASDIISGISSYTSVCVFLREFFFIQLCLSFVDVLCSFYGFILCDFFLVLAPKPQVLCRISTGIAAYILKYTF